MDQIAIEEGPEVIHDHAQSQLIGKHSLFSNISFDIPAKLLKINENYTTK